MAGAQKKKKDEGPPGAPGWMVTYGDMMSLLLCFFVLLLSFSTISEEEFNEALMSLQGALGIMPQQLSIIRISPTPPRAARAKRDVERLARELRRRLQVLGKEKDVDVRYDKEGGLKISLPSRILFDSARAELKTEAYPVLQDVAELLAGVPEATIQVQGHTDSRRLISTQVYRDNYDLSYYRADAVARYLTRAGDIPLEQFEIIATGPSQPVATNGTEEGRQANRRVEIYVRGQLDESTIKRMREQIEELAPGREEVD